MTVEQFIDSMELASPKLKNKLKMHYILNESIEGDGDTQSDLFNDIVNYWREWFMKQD